MDYSRRQFVRSLFIASQATILGRFAPGNLYADAGSSAALNFLVLGDWGHRGQFQQKAVADQMALTAGKIGAKFVIAVGDNFYLNGVESVDDDHWQESFENIYSAKSLQIPWYAILGNHDYHGNCDAQLEYAKTALRWTMPNRYYQQTHSINHDVSADFFYLDTPPMIREYYKTAEELPEHQNLRKNVLTQDVPAQKQWFEKALAASKADWKFVFGHHPVYSGGYAHGDQKELIEYLLPLLHQYKVQAYFCGHDHDLQHLQEGGVNFFLSGGGFEHRPDHEIPQSLFVKPAAGFMAVSLRSEEMQVQVIDSAGQILHTASVPRVGATV